MSPLCLGLVGTAETSWLTKASNSWNPKISGTTEIMTVPVVAATPVAMDWL
jgi:hypothetical protein